MFLKGKNILIVGLASTRSIAYGVAQALHAQGANLALAYQDDKLAERVKKMGEEFNSTATFQCDVSKDEQITALMENVGKAFDGKLDGIIHSVAFAPRDHLEGNFVDVTTREGFALANDISSYSFVALAKAARSILQPGASLVTMTYLGAERAAQNYNVMGVAKASLEATTRYMADSLGPEGIRVNAVSAGPIRTLAASGIRDFKKMLDYHERLAPMRSLVTIEQVGNTTMFLCSELASGITGEVIHVDGGYHAIIPSRVDSE